MSNPENIDYEFLIPPDISSATFETGPGTYVSKSMNLEEYMASLSVKDDVKAPLPLEQRERHKTLWFKNGNVVIATSKLLFKVYDGILAMHSGVFGDMFSLPQTQKNGINAASNGEANGAEELEGVPVVHMHDDPEEVEHLLSAIYDRFYYCPKSRTDFSTVISLLRLGTKYQISPFREESIEQLSTVYADTLEQMDLVMNDVSSKLLVYNESDLKLLKVAYETQAMRLLPAAFYWITNDPAFDYEVLPKADVSRILNGRGRLRTALSEHIGKFLYQDHLEKTNIDINDAENTGDDSDTNAMATNHNEIEESFVNTPNCFGGDRCKKLREHFIHTEWWELWHDRPSILDPGLVDGALKGLSGMCVLCRAMLLESMKEGRERVWDELPRYFDLPNWEKLRETTGC